MYRRIYETLHPEIYHGYRKNRPYFEGWYYKLVSADETMRYAIIPGVFKGEDSTRDHAFVQVLDGMTGKATYHTFDIDAFHADEEVFDIRIGGNRFRRDCLQLQIDDDQSRIHGTIQLGKGRGWPVRLHEPGVMGWYAWLPFMECYHGILSFDHRLDGSFNIDGNHVDFSGGRGYMEKDWGQAFPSAYIWMQSNHFDHPGTSLFGSVAMIPWIGRTFRGFLLGFYHDRTLYKMTTYTGARVEQLELDDTHVYLTVADNAYRLDITAERGSGGLLMAPYRNEMHQRADETMQSTIEVRLSTHNGRPIYTGSGRNAALETNGDMETLLNTR